MSEMGIANKQLSFSGIYTKRPSILASGIWDASSKRHLPPCDRSARGVYTRHVQGATVNVERKTHINGASPQEGI